MSMHVDPQLVAGFAAEVRSHLPEIRESVGRYRDDSDAEALAAARSRLEGMRDASAMVGLEPLGRALDSLLEVLGRDPGPSASAPEAERPSLAVPLDSLAAYLEDLEESQQGSLEPEQLMAELEALRVSAAPPASAGEEESPQADAPATDPRLEVRL
ncbi:MAG: hypothetical protein AAF725_10135, partial [Acidobacteriota bacterium]